MNKTRLTALIAASLTGLMLSATPFAADADKPQSPSMAPQGSTPATEDSNAAAKAESDFKAAIAQCDPQESSQRSACVAEAEAAQTLAMNKAQNGSDDQKK
jgi:hypothetical protein